MGGAAALSLCVSPVTRLLEHLWPPTREEELSELRFLHDQVLKDPETALSLIQREQGRLTAQLTLYIRELRKALSGNGRPAYDAIHAAFQSVAREIDSYTTEIFQQEITAEDSERALNTQNRQKLLEGLEEVIRGLVVDLDRWVRVSGGGSLRDSFVEGIDALLMTACDAADSSRMEDVEVLVNITRDRGELLREMRQSYLAEESSLTFEARQLFFRVTGHFENAVWLLGRIAQLKRQQLLSEGR
ncbi:MAG TPA: hypothetical protein VNL14_02585 [Candidatus Acidoferrales bacterium]|nr:hypothetical protein [Candidatus Acidoferrales bacterium]